jgi:hypothetical protein
MSDIIMPSDVERSEWPDATVSYVEYLEEQVESLEEEMAEQAERDDMVETDDD